MDSIHEDAVVAEQANSTPEVETCEIDVWEWSNKTADELGLDELLAAQNAVLGHRGARSQIDRKIEELGDVEAGKSPESMKKGLALWLRGDYARAYDHLQHHKSSPSLIHAYAHCSLFCGQSSLDGARSRPEETVEALTNLTTRNDASTTLLLRALFTTGRNKDARKILNKSGDSYSATADGQYFEGWALEREGEYESAQAHFDKALELDPEHQLSLFHLAYQHDISGEDDVAIELYERLSKTNPTHINAIMNLGVLYEDTDRYNEATYCYKRVLAAYPQHARARLFLKDAQASLTMHYDEDQEVRKDKKIQILNIPISDFELSVRSRNCLAKMNISTLGDLVAKTEAELLSYKNFGETSLTEIKQILDSKGLRLGMKPDDEILPIEKPEALLATPEQVAPVNISPNDERLQKSVNELALSVRSRKCLANLNIQTLQDLCAYTMDELLAQRNFGMTSLKEITAQIELIGLGLRTIDK